MNPERTERRSVRERAAVDRFVYNNEVMGEDKDPLAVEGRGERLGDIAGIEDVYIIGWPFSRADLLLNRLLAPCYCRC